MSYNYPADLLTLQRDLTAARAELGALLNALPYSVDPLDAWERPEGYWAGARTVPASPGWTPEQQQEVAALREQVQHLAIEAVTHPYWETLDPADRLSARDGLKHQDEPAAA
ncbi:hypothetical protein [Streptomyces sp. SPB074]|uniref:hypothetical protein n=1 Tax=Streptomyces sp. (strain SPB074) TaxID=465543 RepID=UPI00017F23A6|nr:hypothetical protein [Streptomyces sp. SPB074]EDY42086.1 conserved hypothetical protein [Streptomyces sp. SPB074]